jgi:hypothetical protein
VLAVLHPLLVLLVIVLHLAQSLQTVVVTEHVLEVQHKAALVVQVVVHQQTALAQQRVARAILHQQAHHRVTMVVL